MKKTESDLGKYVFMSRFLLPNGMLDYFDIVKVEGGDAVDISY
jgi:hypothetical protein